LLLDADSFVIIGSIFYRNLALIEFTENLKTKILIFGSEVQILTLFKARAIFYFIFCYSCFSCGFTWSSKTVIGCESGVSAVEEVPVGDECLIGVAQQQHAVPFKEGDLGALLLSGRRHHSGQRKPVRLLHRRAPAVRRHHLPVESFFFKNQNSEITNLIFFNFFYP